MFKGSLPALVTPFKNGSLDLDALKHLVDWHVEQGSDGLVPVGLGVVAYGGASVLLGLPEARQIHGLLRRRGRPPKPPAP